jgi:cytochrome c oxidase subunit 1
MAQPVTTAVPRTVHIMPPMLRGFLWAGIAFIVLNSVTAALNPDYGHPFLPKSR